MFKQRLCKILKSVDFDTLIRENRETYLSYWSGTIPFVHKRRVVELMYDKFPLIRECYFFFFFSNFFFIRIEQVFYHPASVTTRANQDNDNHFILLTA